MLGSDINKIMKNISQLSNINGLNGNFPKMPEIDSMRLIDPFHKSITAEEALAEEDKCIEERFEIDKHNCEICDSTLADGAYILKGKIGENTLYFCSIKCVNHFKDNGHYLNDYELFNVSRCASYKCCFELGNLRRMCEKTKSLTNIDMITNLNRVNFCEPAVAGQIQASYAIYKHLQKVDEENKKLSDENTKLNERTQFFTIVSTVMAILTIILTIIGFVKDFTNKPIDYSKNLIDIIQNEEILIEEGRINKQEKKNIYNKLEEINKTLEHFKGIEGEKSE